MNDLPPGVSSSNIPGNTADDVKWEELYDWLCDTGLEPDDIMATLDIYSRITQWAKETMLPPETEWEKGYERARAWVRMQIDLIDKP